MIRSTLITALLLFPLSASAIEQDKLLHFAGSFVINTAVYAACINALGKDKENECFAIALGSTLAIGAVKEVMDGDKNSTSEHFKDMGANSAGALGSGLILKFAF